jgi:hypothetical protein
MALKFRRGTTAQQSGSLAFGEPYVNTTLGTLLIGGQSGDIVLSAGGTGSTGNFGAISGSGLDITGNANIAGNLTLGGAITIGDASADTVNVVASLSSSLIPQTTNAFDLGSATKIWRDLYISTGSIKFVEGTSVVKSLSAATLTALETATGSANVSVAALNSFSSSQLTQNTALATISGSLIGSASVASVSITNLNSATASLLIETANLESFTSSINTTIKSKLDADGVVSGSSQITAGSTTNFTTDVKTQLNSNTVVSGSSQVISILSSLNTYTGSNDTTNTTQTSRLDQLSTASGSAITRLTALEVETANLESFTSSINTTIKTRLDANTVVSGSSQVTLSSTTGYGNVINQNVLTTSNVQHASLGIGMAASGTAGRIDATNDVVAFSSSDIRFKENIKPIENAIDKIRKISGNTYDWKEENKVEHGYEGNDVGVIAQEIEAVLPQLVQTRESGFKAVKYDKLVALLIEGIKEQQLQIEQLRIDLNNCRNKGL